MLHAIIPAYIAVDQVIPSAPRATQTRSSNPSQYRVLKFYHKVKDSFLTKRFL